MMNTQKRNRPHRPNTNTGNRAPKGRGSFDKNVPMNEGIFNNPRFTYLATSLVGCCVQLQVKNGKCYEGILKTCSPKMDVVLEMAHKVDDTGNNNIPSRELVQDKIIFNCADILMITAVDVDLDYAVKDSFTDTAITKQNGVGEKELRELTPWEPEDCDAHHGGGGGGGLTDGPSSNGWDPNDMFSINERQFNVKSTYDDSLHQYTVPLEKRDTKEYKEKEERAAMLAQEIERSDGYKQRIDLENDGDDEEAKFSAVVRPESSASNPGKYVPPGKRNQFNQQRNARHGPPGNASNRIPVHQPPPQPTAPRLAGQQSREDLPPRMASQHSREDLPPRLAAQQSREDIPPRLASQSSREDLPPRLTGQHSREDLPPRLAAQHSREDVSPRLAAQQSREDVKVNGNDGKEEVKNDETSSPDALSAGTDKAEPVHTSPVSKMERKNPTPKGQAALLQDLKEFSKNFKLSDDSKETKTSQENAETKSDQKEEDDKVKSPAPSAVSDLSSSKEDSQEDKPDMNVLTTSKLNPNAPSFVFNPSAKSFQPKQHPQQVTTPPRPQTQSPILQPMPPAMPPMIQPVIFHQPHFSQQLQQTAQPRPPPKRAVVSIQPPRTDFTAAAAQAATGAPLLAHTPFSTVQYQSFMMPQPASYQVGQVMPMPSATPAAGPRMMTPPSGATMEVNQQPSGPTMFMGPNGPMPAHIPHQPYHNPQPAHIGPHPQGQQNHPAPSPVQHVVTSQSQSHPPTSNTPQPHNPYQQMSLQGHPPLQPSPHNPASPQTVHMPAVQYQFPIQMQGAAGNQVMSQTHPPTSVPHSIHSNMQPHFVMMPHVHNQHNQQSHQFQPHIGPGQTSMVHQAGVPTAIQNTQPGAQFIPQVYRVYVLESNDKKFPSQGAPPSIQNFQQNH